MLQRIAEETERAKHYLDDSSEGPILKVVEQELIIRNMLTVINMENGGAVYNLENNKYEGRILFFLRMNTQWMN